MTARGGYSISVKMEPDVYEAVERVCGERLVGRNLLVNQAIRFYVDCLETGEVERPHTIPDGPRP